MLFLGYTGVRFGEMAALRVSRLDLRRNRAIIAESVTPVQGLGLVWGTPKTHQAREVPIPQFLPSDLGRHIEGKQPDDLVFAGIRNGQPLRVGTFHTAFSAAARAIGVPTSTRTSSGTRPRAWPSPAVPTSRSCSRCWDTARRR